MGVVRIGDTVRRQQSRNSACVHRLLRHLEVSGFDAAPRVLGVDENGREILSFLPGETTFGEELWTRDAPLVAAANMLRALHDATTTFDWGDAGDWAYAWPNPSERTVVCHNDFAPYNMMFRDGLPVGIIDFDLCGPGPRLRDLAYLAYWLVPLSFGEGEMVAYSEHQRAAEFPRLRLLCDTYGTKDISGLLAMVSHVLEHMASEDACAAMIGAMASARLRTGGHFAHWQMEAAAYGARLPELKEHLG